MEGILDKINENDNKNIKQQDENAVQFKCTDAQIIQLTKAHETDNGYDVSSCEDQVILPRQRKLIKTGLYVQFPKGLYGRLAPRSGLAVKNGIDVGAGVIDTGYTGEIRVLLFNHSDEQFVINKGDRIAQLLFCIQPQISLYQMNEQQDLLQTDRGFKGFGSSGV